MKKKRARFIGKNGSLGYKTNKIYDIEVFKPNLLQRLVKYGWDIEVIVLCDAHPNCPYSTWDTFFQNWKYIYNP